MRTKRYPHRRRRILPRLIVLLVVLAAGWFWLQWQCHGIKTTATQVELTDFPSEFDGLRIAHLSDIHGYEFGENSEVLIEKVAEQQPDLIVITGDIVDHESQLTMIPSLARGLCAIAPAYYVTGNHEWSVEWSGRKDFVRTLKSLLEGCGVTVLSNEYIPIEAGGALFVLAGVDDPNGYADQKTPEELYAEIREEYPDLFILLLAHRNDAIERYAAAGYDFVLSGHGHGGIIRLPFTDGLLSPARTLFPSWTAGIYTVEDTTLFVSRGLGNNTVPVQGFRLFNRPDLAILELKSVK